MRTLPTLLVGVLIGAAGIGGVSAATASGEAPVPSSPTNYLHGPVGHAVRTECQTEDSVNCHWDARTRGDLKGHSSYSITGRNDRVCIYYTEAAYNRAHSRCYAH